MSRNQGIYIGKRLLELRKSRGFTQADLARKLGLHKGSISAYERDSMLPSIEILMDLAEIYGVTIDYILGKTDEAQRKYYLTERQQEAIEYLMKTLEQENIQHTDEV